ncbi:hypothetical protein CH373_05925 [Leptospira perolatii]|uniref:Exo-alpha-sialidase n=1 Tax=Leptospira perolatii TaxID=2023191 RepID=A0A2M9ZQU0_9LEPT|nr:hypothetical protein [Leptospira perolatii]PJZ68372.1 hypothetical protein CH360_16480 [Leptospira perolatii]PJZ74432.1 hypothetical protein CH373_05925 [Leptospira perolatii]
MRKLEVLRWSFKVPFFLVFFFCGCLKFHEHIFDPFSKNSVLITLLTGPSTPYSFFPTRDQKFRTVGGNFLTYITRYRGFGGVDSKIHLVITDGAGSTRTASTNVPGTNDTTYTRLVGAGQDSSPSLFLIFETSSGLGQFQYYHWSGASLPLQDDHLIFTQIVPPNGDPIIQNVTALGSEYVWCEQPSLGIAGACYHSPPPFPNVGSTVSGITTCNNPVLNASFLMCFDFLSLSSPITLTGPVVDSAVMTASSITHTLPSGYPTLPSQVNGVYSYALDPNNGGGYFFDTNTNTIGVGKSTDLMYNSGSVTLTYNTTINEPSVASAGAVIFEASLNGPGPSLVLSIDHSDLPSQTPDRPLYMSLDGGQNWTGVSFNGLPLDAGGIGNYPTAYGTIINVNTLTMLINAQFLGGSGLYQYTSTDGGATWSGPTEVPESTEP